MRNATFRTTHWSVVRTAGGPHSEAAARALEILCRSYWFPVYAHVRRCGYPAEEAQDLTQGFFAELLAKNRIERADQNRGRFRSFLLASANHFLGHEREKQAAAKRGSGRAPVALDALESEERYALEPATQLVPEVLFDQRWARVVLDRVLRTLRSEFDLAGQVKRFDLLKPFLTGDTELSLADAATKLEMSQPAIKSAVHRLRARFRELFRSEITETVLSPDDVDDEMRHLLRSLRTEST